MINRKKKTRKLSVESLKAIGKLAGQRRLLTLILKGGLGKERDDKKVSKVALCVLVTENVKY